MLSWREDERLHDLNDLLFFAAVVEHSGFSAAARFLNLPKSSVSRHVGRLEDRLGVRLLERSTRNVRLTEIGSSYYARCKAILSELETAEHDLALLRSDPIGTIRVSCPTGLAQYALARIVPGFLADYPLVRVQIIASAGVIYESGRSPHGTVCCPILSFRAQPMSPTFRQQMPVLADSEPDPLRTEE